MFVQALKALERYPTPKSRHALTSTIENEKCFYLIRIDAAKSLAKVSVFFIALILAVLLPQQQGYVLPRLVCLSAELLRRLWMKLLEGLGFETKQAIKFCGFSELDTEICFHFFNTARVPCMYAV